MARKDKHANGTYRRYPPPMNHTAWLTLGILIGILIAFVCIRISE